MGHITTVSISEADREYIKSHKLSPTKIISHWLEMHRDKRFPAVNQNYDEISEKYEKILLHQRIERQKLMELADFIKKRGMENDFFQEKTSAKQ